MSFDEKIFASITSRPECSNTLVNLKKRPLEFSTLMKISIKFPNTFLHPTTKSLFLFLIAVAGGIFQWPIGYYSDKTDRRIIIIICTFISAFFCILLISASGASLQNIYLATGIGVNKFIFFTYIVLYSGMAVPLFTLNLAYVNDYIPREKFVSAGGGMQIIFGIGAIGVPIIASIFMDIYGPNGFFVNLALYHVLIGIFGMYRITKRDYEDNPDSTFTPLPRNITPLGIELDPTTDADLSNMDKK